MIGALAFSLMAATLAAPAKTAPPKTAPQGTPTSQATLALTTTCVDRLCNAAVLQPFLEKLASHSQKTLHILQIGDSHTAGDTITQGWRMPFQNLYGHGGRGVMTAGRPYNGFISWGITAAQSGPWLTSGIFGKSWSPSSPAIGLSGYTQSVQQSGATISLAADDADNNFDQVTLCGLTGPDMGDVGIAMGETTAIMSFSAPTSAARCQRFDSPHTTASVTFTSLSDKMVSLTSIATFRSAGGVVISNLGVSGSQWRHFARTSDMVITTELQAYQPDLVVIAFGTNEGFDAAWNSNEYKATIRQQITRLRQLLGGTIPILLLGAPDATAREMNPAMAGMNDTILCANDWKVPANLAKVRQEQRLLANEAGLAYWDWNKAMGGACASLLWRDDNLMYPDHIHYTKTGGALLGAMIAADLDQALWHIVPVR